MADPLGRRPRDGDGSADAAARRAAIEVSSDGGAALNLLLIDAATNRGPLAPAWLVIPVCALAMLVTAAHVLIVQRAEMPPSRKRIRTVTGILLLVTSPLLGIALGGVDLGDRRKFVMIWVVVMGLLVMAIALACLDMLNSVRIAVLEQRQLAKEAREEARKMMEEGKEEE